MSGQPAYHAVCEVLHRHGFAGASVFLGVDGTKHGQRQRARFFSRNVDIPVMIIAVGTGAQVDDVVPELAGAAARATDDDRTGTAVQARRPTPGTPDRPACHRRRRAAHCGRS